jgi:archaellum biogenesis ATPase FlaH
MGKFVVKKATRKAKKLKALITGQTGAGKSTSALLLAKGLTDNGKVLVYDTENGRASLKADSPLLKGWEFDVAEVTPSEVTSLSCIEAITYAEENGYDAIILDSITHEWESVKANHQKLGGRFTDWGKAKEPHLKFVRKVISAGVHVILTARSEIKHEQQEVNGRKQVVKLGLGTQTNSNFPYEIDFLYDIQDRDHNAISDKYEGGLYDGLLTFIISEQTGRDLAEWLSSGVDPEEETKKLYISRINQLQVELVDSGIIQESDLVDPNKLKNMELVDLTALGGKLKSLKDSGAKAEILESLE